MLVAGEGGHDGAKQGQKRNQRSELVPMVVVAAAEEAWCGGAPRKSGGDAMATVAKAEQRFPSQSNVHTSIREVQGVHLM